MFINNVGAGILMEYNSRFNVIRNNVVYGTRYSRWTGAGILSHATGENVYVHNTIIGNEGIGLWIRRDPGNRSPEGKNKIFNNLLVNNGTNTSGASGVVTCEIFLATGDNEMNGNQYWTHDDGSTFCFGPARWEGNDLDVWRRHSGAEELSTLLDPASPVIQNPADPAGWRLVASSQALQKAVPLPEELQVTYDIEREPRQSGSADVGADQLATVSPAARTGRR
jgi:hypothetical protein